MKFGDMGQSAYKVHFSFILSPFPLWPLHARLLLLAQLRVLEDRSMWREMRDGYYIVEIQ